MMPTQQVAAEIADLAKQLRRRIRATIGPAPCDVAPLEPEELNTIALTLAELTAWLTRELEEYGFDEATQAAEACERLVDRVLRSVAPPTIPTDEFEAELAAEDEAMFAGYERADLLELHQFGHCEICKAPFRKGEAIAEPRYPDGTIAKVHPTCLEK